MQGRAKYNNGREGREGRGPCGQDSTSSFVCGGRMREGRKGESVGNEIGRKQSLYVRGRTEKAISKFNSSLVRPPAVLYPTSSPVVVPASQGDSWKVRPS